MRKGEEDPRKRLRRLVEHILNLDEARISKEEGLELNYKLRKHLEHIMTKEDSPSELINVYYELGDNYRVILQDGKRGTRHLRFLSAKILALMDSAN